MDPSTVLQIDRILEPNDKQVLLSFMGNEINARWVTREELNKQGLSDRIAYFLDSSQSTLISATPQRSARFTMS